MIAELVFLQVECAKCQNNISLPYVFEGMDMKASIILAFCNEDCKTDYELATFSTDESS